jgi:hypothetical protein
MDIYSHICNKWAQDYIGKTVDETKILMEHDFPAHKLHIINIKEDDPQIDEAYEDLKRLKTERRYTSQMYYTQKFFKPPIQNGLQVIEYKGVVINTKVY